MKINKISLKNWMNISEASLDFTDGINVLYGNTGEGKSAILEAIAFCLLDHKKGDKWAEYIKTDEESFSIHMEVQLTNNKEDIAIFDYSGSASDSSMSKNILYNGATYTNSTATEFINSKLDVPMLKNSVFNLQTSESISSFSPAERREIFKKLFNSDFSDIVEKIKNETADLKEKIGYADRDIQTLKAKEYVKVRPIFIDEEVYTASLKEVSELTEQSKTLFETISSLDKMIQDEKMKKLSWDREYSTLVGEQNLLSEKLKNLISSRDSLQAKLNTIDETILGCNNNIIDYTTKLEAEQKESGATYEMLNAKKLELEADKKKIDTLVVKKIHKQTHLATNKEGFCNSCGQECSPQNVVEIEKELEAITNEHRALEETYNICKALVAKLEDEDRVRNTKIIVLKTNIQNEKNILETNKKYKDSYSEEMISIPNKIAEAEKALNDKKIAIESLESMKPDVSSVEGYEKDKETIKTQKAVVDTILSEKKIDIAETEKNKAINEERRKANERVAEEEIKDKERIALLTKEIEESKKTILESATLQKIFDVDFPNYINTKACSILQDHMNTFMKPIKENLELMLNQNKKGVEFKYRSRNEKSFRSTKMASGFETALLTLAFKTSVAEFYNSSLLICDEPDKTSTEADSAKLFEILTGMTKFEQLFVITHKPAAMEFLKESGSNIYYVKNGTFTKI
ncbi:MAG: hypothetical protein KA027_01920 [Candidatus Methanofastidiosum sp.]|nr:hypothetical protein [Methanofastidiosum sp.]